MNTTKWNLMEITQQEYKHLLAGHTVFIIIGILLLLVLPISKGIIFLILVVIYNSMLPLWAKWTDKDQVFDIWLFSFLLSNIQIIPDWILSSYFQVLVFPDDGLFRIGTVAGYMIGLWTIPFVLIISSGLWVENQTEGTRYQIVAVILMSSVIFVSSEMFLWRLGSWYAVDVIMTYHIAHYIIIPEIILGILVFFGYKNSREMTWISRYCGLVVIMLAYIGAVVISYFFIEFL